MKIQTRLSLRRMLASANKGPSIWPTRMDKKTKKKKKKKKKSEFALGLEGSEALATSRLLG
jgi:hypothetical protein